MRVALIQQHAGPDRERNLERALEAMRRAAGRGAHLAVFPELAVEPFFPRFRRDEIDDPPAESVPGPVADRVAERAAELSMVTVFNLHEEADEGRRYDSSPVFDADGSLLGVTRMVHVTDFEGFHERDWYEPGDRGAPVYDTAVGRIGVAICYDRHYPEYMRALGAAGAELVAVPQAGIEGGWPEGLHEAEMRVAAFQNGYWVALCNRVGPEDGMTFAGASFVVDPEGTVTARAEKLVDDVLVTEVDLDRCADSTARRLFWRDRRPGLYEGWLDRAGRGGRGSEVSADRPSGAPLRIRERSVKREASLQKTDAAAILTLAASLVLAACSGGGSDIEGTWRAAADTMAPMPSVLYEFRPGNTMVLHLRAQDTETEGTWMMVGDDRVRVEFREGSYFAGRELEGRLLAPDSLVLEIQGEERVFVPHDTAADGPAGA